MRCLQQHGTTAPLVSVLVPAFNAAKYIGTALDSVLAQTYSPIELIVVDDGSTDQTREVLSRYRERGVRIVHQDNAGQCAAVNRAFRESNGDLIKFFDADDVLSPDHIAKQVSRLGPSRSSVCIGEWDRFYDDPCEARFPVHRAYRDCAPVDWITAELSAARPMMQCALWLIPRRLVDLAGPWDERLSLINDFEYFIRLLLQADRILYSPGARLYYRSGVGGSLSSQSSRHAVESAFLALTTGTNHLLRRENTVATRRACANVLQDFVHTYYPDHNDLRAKMEERVRELGGSDLAPDGPPGFQVIRRLVGWRFARRLERAVIRASLNRAALRRLRPSRVGRK